MLGTGNYGVPVTPVGIRIIHSSGFRSDDWVWGDLLCTLRNMANWWRHALVPPPVHDESPQEGEFSDIDFVVQNVTIQGEMKVAQSKPIASNSNSFECLCYRKNHVLAECANAISVFIIAISVFDTGTVDISDICAASYTAVRAIQIPQVTAS